jgi:copper(I)-binding protein
MSSLARFAVFGLLLPALSAHAGAQLRVEQAWIRTAPPGAMAMAGYAVLRNVGDAPAVVKGASSDAFASASLHETVESDGVARMRAVDALTVTPGASVALAPGGKHLMLMHPGHALVAGAKVTIRFELESAPAVQAEFTVREDAPAAH